jgi:hypothetical protein
MRIVCAALAIAALLQPRPGAADCRYDEPREAGLDAVGVRRVRVDAKAGALRIHGGTGSRVEVRGTACASSRDRLEKITLRAERDGDEVRIDVEMPEGDWSLFGGGSRLDLEIDVPESVELDIEDSSGALEISDVASLRLEDSSGSIEVTHVAGDVSVRDSSGEVEIEAVTGDVRISDGSGSIRVRDVRGSVTVDEDGSGSIDVSDVERDVRIGRDGSGSIRVERVGGDFTVERDGSGGIRHRDVEGRVDVPGKR